MLKKPEHTAGSKQVSHYLWNEMFTHYSNKVHDRGKKQLRWRVHNDEYLTDKIHNLQTERQ